MTDGQMDGGDCNIPDAFLKKRGDTKQTNTCLVEKNNMECPLVILTGDQQSKCIYQLNAVTRIEMKCCIILFTIKDKNFQGLKYILIWTF